MGLACIYSIYYIYDGNRESNSAGVEILGMEIFNG